MTALVALLPDGGVDPTFGTMGFAFGISQRIVVAATATGNGVVTIEQSSELTGELYVTGHDGTGPSVWNAYFAATSPLGSFNPIAAANDHTMRLVIVGTRAATQRAIIARLWL
jgi:hypothetical protein